MCNFYIMYYMVNNGRSLVADDCWNQAPDDFHFPELHVPEPVLGFGIETEADRTHEHTGHDASDDNVDSILLEIHDIIDEIDGESPTTKATPPAKVTLPAVGGLTTKIPPQETTVAETPSNRPFFEGGDHFESDPTGGMEPRQDPTGGMEPGQDPTGGMEPGQDFTLELAEDWPLNGLSSPRVGDITLGQVTAVAVDHAGFVHIFHRGPTTWDFRCAHTLLPMHVHFYIDNLADEDSLDPRAMRRSDEHYTGGGGGGSEAERFCRGRGLQETVGGGGGALLSPLQL